MTDNSIDSDTSGNRWKKDTGRLSREDSRVDHNDNIVQTGEGLDDSDGREEHSPLSPAGDENVAIGKL